MTAERAERERGPAGCWGRAQAPGARSRSGATEVVRAAPGRELEAPGGVGGAAWPRSPLTILLAPGREGRREGAPAASSVRGGALSYRWGRRAAGVSSSAVARAQAPASPPRPPRPIHPPPTPTTPSRPPPRRLSRRRLSHRRLSGHLSRRYRRQSPSAGARTGARGQRARARLLPPPPPTTSAPGRRRTRGVAARAHAFRRR